MFELKKYGENIEAMRSQMSGGKLPGKSIQVTKQLDPKTLSTDPNHLGNSISNHIPASPAVVEVSPMHSDRSNHAIISEPSSPDTPPGLQIDLEDSTQVSKHQSPSKGLGMLNSIERNSQVRNPFMLPNIHLFASTYYFKILGCFEMSIFFLIIIGFWIVGFQCRYRTPYCH